MSYLSLTDARTLTGLSVEQIDDTTLQLYLDFFDEVISYESQTNFSPAPLTERFYPARLGQKHFAIGVWNGSITVSVGSNGNDTQLTEDKDYYRVGNQITLLTRAIGGNEYLSVTGNYGTATLPTDIKEIIRLCILAKYAHDNQIITTNFGTAGGMGAITEENDQSTSVKYQLSAVVSNLGDIASGNLSRVPSFSRIFSQYRLNSLDVIKLI